MNINNNLHPLIIIQKTYNKMLNPLFFQNILPISGTSVAFIDIPKCASSSLKWYLKERLTINSFLDRCNIDNPYPHAVPLPRISRFSILRSDSYSLRIAFVRDPLERVFSTYQEKVQYNKGLGYGSSWIYSGHRLFGKRSGNTDFSDFLRKIIAESPNNLDKHIKPYSLIISSIPDELKPNLFVNTQLTSFLFSILDQKFFQNPINLNDNFKLNQTNKNHLMKVKCNKPLVSLIKKYYEDDYKLLTKAVNNKTTLIKLLGDV